MSDIHSNVESTKKPAPTKIFNSLPVEIIKKIFCTIGNPYLFDMKSVCWFWYNIIQDILHVQVTQVSNERCSSAASSFEDLGCDENCVFKICQVRYPIYNVICERIIYDQTGGDIHSLLDSSYSGVFDMLEYAARNDTSRTTSKDTAVVVWRIIFAMTGINCSVDQLRNKNVANEEKARSLLRNHRWYTYKVEDEFYVNGIVALYPDSRTFAIFQGVLPDDSDYGREYYPYHDDYYNDYFYYGVSDYEWY